MSNLPQTDRGQKELVLVVAFLLVEIEKDLQKTTTHFQLRHPVPVLVLQAAVVLGGGLPVEGRKKNQKILTAPVAVRYQTFSVVRVR